MPELRSEGFTGQRLVLLPQAALALSRHHPLLKGLHPTRAGYFPSAVGHRMQRNRGVTEAILILCVQGRGWATEAGGRRLPVRPGTALVIPPGVPHSYGADEKSPWTIAWVHFRGLELRAYLPLLLPKDPRRIAVLKASLESRSAFERLVEGYSSGFAFLHLLAAVAELRKGLAHMLLTSRASSRRSTDAEGRIDESIRWLNGHWQERLSVEVIASRAGFSVPHFITLFRARTGASPVNYFLRLKIQRACHLLDTTSSPIKVLAESVGFSDPYYFSRLFRNVMGVSPRHYRKMDKI